MRRRLKVCALVVMMLVVASSPVVGLALWQSSVPFWCAARVGVVIIALSIMGWLLVSADVSGLGGGVSRVASAAAVGLVAAWLAETWGPVQLWLIPPAAAGAVVVSRIGGEARSPFWAALVAWHPVLWIGPIAWGAGIAWTILLSAAIVCTVVGVIELTRGARVPDTSEPPQPGRSALGWSLWLAGAACVLVISFGVR